MPTTPVTCPLDCADACGVLVESDESGRFAGLRGNPAHGYSRGHLCGKTAIYGDLVTAENRLRTPLVREGSKSSGRLVPASWDEAIERIVERVAPLKGHGERILAAWYAGSMGRVQRFFPVRMMHALGATLVDGGLCDNATTAGYECVLGDVYGPDIDEAGESGLVVLWGCDMVRTVQHLQPAVQKLAKRGVPVVAIDIYRTDTIRALERWGGEGMLVRPGTDAMLALALARLAFERGAADREFLARCTGAREFEEHVRADHDLATASRVTGLDAASIERLYALLARAERPLIKTGVGFGRRRNGAMQMRAVCSLACALGVADRVHYESFATFQLADDVIARPDLRRGAPVRHIHHVQLGRELGSGRFGAVFVWCHNPASVCPESALVRRGLARDDVFVVVHEQFLTETAELADVVLPATMFVEHADLYRSYGHRYLQYSRRASEPPPGPRSNVDAFAAIARALGLPRETWDATSESLADELIRASAHRLPPGGLERLLSGEPVKLSPPGRLGHGTPSGRPELFSRAALVAGQPPMASYVPDDACDDAGEYWLVCAPSIDTHNSTYTHSARHLKRRGAHRAFLAPDDARRIGVGDGDWITLSNRRGSISLPVAVASEMPEGLVRVDGLPRAADVPERIGVNTLVGGEISDMGASNVLYSTRVGAKRRA
jgi:anaerobic selenocysteine-containing dehydrogenase